MTPPTQNTPTQHPAAEDATSDGLTLTQIVDLAKVSDDARLMLKNSMSPQAFFSAVYRQEKFDDAVRLVPWILPVRSGIWWASLCLWEIYRPAPSQLTSDTMEAVVGWVIAPRPESAKDPDDPEHGTKALAEMLEKRRRYAGDLAQRCGATTPAGNLGMAVFFSGGSVSLPKLPEVAAKPDQAPKLITGAVVAAAKLLESRKAKQPWKQFADLAIRVSREELPWEIQESDPEQAARLGLHLAPQLEG